MLTCNPLVSISVKYNVVFTCAHLHYVIIVQCLCHWCNVTIVSMRLYVQGTINICLYYLILSYITGVLGCLKSPRTPLFAQQLVTANNKDSIKSNPPVLRVSQSAMMWNMCPCHDVIVYSSESCTPVSWNIIKYTSLENCVDNYVFFYSTKRFFYKTMSSNMCECQALKVSNSLVPAIKWDLTIFRPTHWFNQQTTTDLTYGTKSS